jgi:hypothetical protein
MLRAVFAPVNLMAAACTGLLVALAVVGSGCAATKEARLGVEEALQPRVVERITSQDSGPVEIRCGVGELCSEVRVIHVQRHTDGGVEVTIMNRTEEAIAIQVQIEGEDSQHRRVDRSGFHDVVIAPRGEEVFAVSTLTDTQDTLILHLRARAS